MGFIPFPRVLVLCEMQSVSSRIWTRIAVTISRNDNHYTTGTSKFKWLSLPLHPSLLSEWWLEDICILKYQIWTSKFLWNTYNSVDSVSCHSDYFGTYSSIKPNLQNQITFLWYSWCNTQLLKIVLTLFALSKLKGKYLLFVLNFWIKKNERF